MVDTTMFELVSPERLVTSKDVSMVVVPGANGFFGVLPRHSPLISTLIPGVIDVYEEGFITDRIFVAGGFAEVTEDRCTVLAELATSVDELDPDVMDTQIANLREQVKDTPTQETARLNKRISELEAVATAMKQAKDA
ncbi:MAG: F0F1 ATP synthase subunit epsilon [Rhodospirillaceae bacterium]|nr:F0F1 ATP synthase subunit epsilon [Rhodospirillaceae bacterium]|tara:strand:- start:22 stop:435 length:414 start_codon:yes stop_codon:yes gene_type:complete